MQVTALFKSHNELYILVLSLNYIQDCMTYKITGIIRTGFMVLYAGIELDQHDATDEPGTRISRMDRRMDVTAGDTKMVSLLPRRL